MSQLLKIDSGKPTQIEPAIVVEMDGALVQSSLLWEAVVIFIKRHGLRAYMLIFWCCLGKEAFKSKLFASVKLDPATLPYDHKLLAFLMAKRAKGQRIILSSKSPANVASAVTAHLDLFSDVLHMPQENVARQLTQTFGDQAFDYIGQKSTDRAIWKLSRIPYSVNHKQLRLPDGRDIKHVGTFRATWTFPLLKAMRPRQWMKNLLVFMPMTAGHMLTYEAFAQSIVAFIAFSLCASSAYLFNDALDAQDDRAHVTKRSRPIAAGTLPIPIAITFSIVLAAVSLTLCYWSDMLLLLVVVVYFISTVSYSLYLKRLLMVDIVTLAILFSLRIIGGSASTRIEPSFWLLTFSFFLFLSLALLKRHSELFNLHQQGKKNTNGRGYTTADKAPVGMMGVSSAFMSVLIFMLYFNSENVLILYPRPAFLLAIVPLLIFWLGRLWILSFRGEVNEDPVLYVSKDSVSLIVIAMCAALGMMASL